MNSLKVIYTILFFSITHNLLSQAPIQVGKGSYASYPPEIVIDEGAYFARSYRTLRDEWPYYISEQKQNEPLPTNSWWSNAVFSQYTGELWVYPQVVEATSTGIQVSAVTDFEASGTRGTKATKGASIYIKGKVEQSQDNSTNIYLDFEDGEYLDGWAVKGDLLTYKPRTIEDHNHSGTPSNYLGNYYLDTYFTGNENQGSLTSPEFVLEHDYMHFLIAGGDTEGAGVRLLVDNEVLIESRGNNSMTFEWCTWDLQTYKGQTVQLQIIDSTQDGWGYIACDNFVLSNQAEISSSFSTDYWPAAAEATDWSELSFTFSLLDDIGRGLICKTVHGVPYTYIDIKDIQPIITVSSETVIYYDIEGNEIVDFPYEANTLILEVDGELFGVHMPIGCSFYKTSDGIEITNLDDISNSYMVISNIPSVQNIADFDNLARNKITNSSFAWEVKMESSEMLTSFLFDTENYETGLQTGETFFTLLPHHWRNTSVNFSYEMGSYMSLIGDMKLAKAKEFEISYPFEGLTPYIAEPLNLEESQKTNLYDLLSTRSSSSGTYNGNTYAKGLGENSNLMLMALEMQHPDFETFRDNLKKELTDWFTFSEDEANSNSYYFAQYPEYGALIGFPPGYGSQGFNDLHFHNGYFVMGAARLMMVDEEFKNEYGEFAKLIARSYASWLRYGEQDDVNLPFLRNFDPYFGHSFAGGTGDAGGNNQESTSESLHSWFAIYNLGVALNDNEIMSIGAAGFQLEGVSADTYWFNRYNDLPSSYGYDYVGIKRTGDLAMATYFSGDPAWAFGIQFVPCDYFYNQIYTDTPEHYESILNSMLTDRLNLDDGYAESTDILENIREMGSYLGGYLINYIQMYDPEMAAELMETLYNEGGDWATSANSATNYYVTNSNLTYGNPQNGYYTSIMSGSVYEDENGELTYMIYNPSDEDKTVFIYDETGTIIDQVTVKSKVLYNSKNATPAPLVSILSHKEGDFFVENKAERIELFASDKDGYIEEVELKINDVTIDKLATAPYYFMWTPESIGEYELVAIAMDDDGQYVHDTIAVTTVANTQESYNDSPFQIPTDIIPAVEYDEGGEGIAYHDEEEASQGNGIRETEGVDSEGGLGIDGNVGWVRDGEWLEYTIEVLEDNVYDITFNFASAYGGGSMYISFDGVDKTGIHELASTSSWGTYKNYVLKNIPLTTGVQKMRLYFVTGGANFKSVLFTEYDEDYTGDNDEINQDDPDEPEDDYSYLTNMALDKPLTFYTDLTEGISDYTVDEDLSTRWTTIFSETTTTIDFEIDLKSVGQLQAIEIYPFQDRDYQFYIEGSVDGITYSVIADYTQNEGYSTKISIPINYENYQYLKFTFTGAGEYDGIYLSIYEIMVYGQWESDVSISPLIFDPVINAEPSSAVISNHVTIEGLNENAVISIEGEEAYYSINNSEYSNVDSIVEEGDIINIRMESCSTYECDKRAIIKIDDENFTFNVTTKSIATGNESISSNIKVYPNPVSNTLFIEADPNSIDKIELYNVSGQIVYLNNNILSIQTGVSVVNYKQGMYLLLVYSKDKCKRFKIYIERN